MLADFVNRFVYSVPVLAEDRKDVELRLLEAALRVAGIIALPREMMCYVSRGQGFMRFDTYRFVLYNLFTVVYTADL